MPLIIDQTKIDKISGPVSMYILSPTQKHLVSYPQSPILILFGDIHENSENMCDKDENIFKIYDINFLKLLSNVSKKEEPVDFFVEGDDFHNSFRTIKYEKQHSMYMLWNLYIECYSKKQLAFYDHETPCEIIKNIRWQSGDPRFFRKGKNKDLLYSCNMLDFSQALIEELKPVKKQDGTYFSNVTSFYIRLKSLIEGLKNNKNCFNKLKQSTLLFEDIYQEFIEDDTGLVNKQLRFLDKYQKNIIKKYLKYYTEYVNINILKRKDYLILDNIHNNIITLLNARDVFDKTEIMQKLYNNFIDGSLTKYAIYQLKKNSVILDIYTIARSLKSTDVNPIINIFYFGNQHIENITYFFTEIMNGYDIIFENRISSNTIRCIDIKPYIDLDLVINSLYQYRRNSLSSSFHKRKQEKSYMRFLDRKEKRCLSINKSNNKRCLNRIKTCSNFCAVHKKS